MKLLTSTAALSILGPEHRFTTSVVSPRAGRIILVGGGDPYLAKTSAARVPKRASITDLAQDTAADAEEAQDQEGAARVRRIAVPRSGLESRLADLLRRPGDPHLGAVGRRGPGQRRLAGSASEQPVPPGRRGVRRGPAAARDRGDDHRVGAGEGIGDG